MLMTVPPIDGSDPADEMWWESLPTELQDEINAVEGCAKPCVWLDLETKRCRHYELRPPVCREFVPGNEVCLEDRELAGIERGAK